MEGGKGMKKGHVGFPLTPLAELKREKRGERGMGVKREREEGWGGGGAEREREGDATLTARTR
jgi:hypothetical protein